MRKYIRELFGLFLLFCALLLFLSLVSFDSTDPSFNHVTSVSGGTHNQAGLFGAYAAGFLNDIFGVCSFLWPFILAALGAAYISSWWTIQWWRWCGLFLLTLCALMAASSLDLSMGDLEGGGMVGEALHHNGKRFLSPVGSFLVWFFVFLAGLQLTFKISWHSLSARIITWTKGKINLKNVAGDSLINEIPGSVAGISRIRLPNLARMGKTVRDAARALAKRVAGNGSQKPEMPDIMMEPEASARPEKIIMPEPEPGPERHEEDPLADPFAQSEDLWDEKNGEEFAPLKDPRAIREPEKRRAPEKPESALPKITEPETNASGKKEEPDFEVESEYPPDVPEAVIPSAPPKPQGDAKFPIRMPEEKKWGWAKREKMDHCVLPLPSLDLLAPPSESRGQSREDLKAKGQSLMACFRDFGINGELVRISPGPVVTMFEMLPASGVSVKRIVNLSDDLSRALKAVAVRIQAPIPGSDTVGIEIPNDVRETVNFRELAECDAFQKNEGQLAMILGKDIVGRPYMADLARMPHLLVAGATGAGKSVCLNGILVSLLYRKQPDAMKLLLVDPKRIEMSAYADLPHLVHPVVTEMADAKNAMDWAVHEMDARYQAMARLGVRNVTAYNNKLAPLADNPPPEFEDLRPMPYLVIVIDELADLMMTAGREVESSIVRLAQLARAAGIHMILATQRPSVDVVTGLIKANFPCRISFQVTSNQDSRTILGEVGAEHLLGRGDMLYKPSGVGLVRLHGPYLSDEEVSAVVNHWKKLRKPEYGIDFSQWSGEASNASGSGGGDVAREALYAEARDFVLSQTRVSISLLQRRFQIGFNKAARYMEQFERDGLIGPPDGSKPRKVIH